ncbi:MAG: Decarbamoylnovobiocin carbamoyltransferase [bacterium]|nr:Decarbamoylnovobiocin carbamoyltransferase [bacterium]MCK6558540.1 carbamoyltransferase [bacterium]NUM64999.1 carbamoyltransferase [candidate division KSB1 bacterium]
MAVLSITQGHDTGAVIVKDGRMLAAISEERLSRIKMDTQFPTRSMQAVMEIAGVPPEEIKHVVIPELRKGEDIFKNLFPKYPQSVFAGANGELKFGDRVRQVAMSGSLLMKTYPRMAVLYRRYEKRLREMFPHAQLHRVEHHVTHAASAYYTSGFEKAIVITGDAWGDFVSTMICVGAGKKMTPVHRCYYPNSLGHYYQSLTNWLGFRGGRHEGKILGLAAFGNPQSPVYDEIKGMLVCEGLDVHAPGMMGKIWHKKMPFAKSSMMSRLVANYKREDIAAAFQRRFEEVVTTLVRNAMAQFQIDNICLAGGIFANVKLNQRVFEVPGVKRIYIFPNMGDGGVCAGGALYYDINQNGSRGSALPHAYLGPNYTEKQMEKALRDKGVPFEYHKDIEVKIAELLMQNKVVARFNGAMEYGPRALGNRSILYPAVDPAVNKWLNERLKRTEFMPFAPVTLMEEAHRCYKNLSGAEFPARFMTITFDCTDFMRTKSPAAVHVDNTARPQLIDEKTNPSYYRIVQEYFKLSGIPSVVNTSFNMHEEPIVCSPSDAIRAFQLGHLDYLAIGPFLVKGQNQN